MDSPLDAVVLLAALAQQTPTPDSVFQLNGTTLLAIGSVLGAMAGGISFLFKVNTNTQERWIKQLELDKIALRTDLEDLQKDRQAMREELRAQRALQERTLAAVEHLAAALAPGRRPKV